jgi:hypothetical protein
MTKVFGQTTTNFDGLIHPQTPEEQERARLLTEKYKMDAEFVKAVNDRYGPLEWRLPESHAIYWAAEGLKHAEANPAKVKKDDLITLRRVIYQSMQLSFQRGRLISNEFIPFDFGPNLDIVPKVSAAYEQAANEDEPNRDHILRAHRNFLRDAAYFLYCHNRLADAARWYKYLSANYPDKTIVDGDTNSFPRNLTLQQYAVARAQEDITETSRDRVKARLEDLLLQAYISLVSNDDKRASGYFNLAEQVRTAYETKTASGKGDVRIPMPPIEDIKREVLNQLLDSEHGWTFAARTALRAKLGMEPEPVPSAATNAPPEKPSGK